MWQPLVSGIGPQSWPVYVPFHSDINSQQAKDTSLPYPILECILILTYDPVVGLIEEKGDWIGYY